MACREGQRQRLVAVRDEDGAFRRLLRRVLDGSGLPQRRRLAKRDQLLSIAAGVEPVGDVAALGEARQLHDANAGSNAGQVDRDLRGMAAAGLVIVRQDADRKGPEVPVQLGRPRVGASGVAGGNEAEAREPVDILLALDDEDGLFGSTGSQLEQPIRKRRDALDLPRPAPLAIRAALAEVLRLEADDLEKQRACLVPVVVGGDDPALRLCLGLRLDRHAELGDQPLGRLAVGQAGVPADEIEGATADLVLVVVPLAALLAGDLDGERAVRAVPELGARRQRRGWARRTASVRDVLDPLAELAGERGSWQTPRRRCAEGLDVVQVNQGSPAPSRRG